MSSESTAGQRPRDDPAAGSVRAVERAIDVLFCFTDRMPVQDVGTLQRSTGLSRPTLYRLLGTLESRGLIYSFGQPRRFQLGYRCATLSYAWGHSTALANIARDRLEELWRETQETVALMVPLSNTHRLCVFELKSPHAISFSRGTGYTEPMHHGASGMAMLAQMSPERVGDALRGLDARLQARITAELPEIRSGRVCATRGDLIKGAAAIAAPVLARPGDPVASVCVFGTALRMRKEVQARCQAAVLRAARDIEDLLVRS